ncbi:MAG: methyltransferase domain-containing protein [Gammaproteobacteria bacterium]|nr:methyltransferase domain-containing protein [Gammaproteobacteria bacterium]
MPTNHFFTRISLFIRELWRRPQAIGAVCPSAPHLTNKMAAQVSKKKPGIVIEVGAGTGAVTKALLARGISPSNLVVIEQSPDLADYLRKQFPGVLVIEGDAAILRQLLPDPNAEINAIVSSLPLLSLPPEQVVAILKEWAHLLPPKSKLIQYTYNFFSSKPTHMIGFTLIKSYSIWLNVPPAKIQVFRKN